MIKLISCLLLLSIPAFAEGKKEHPPFSKMKGGCDNYKTKLKAEFAAWKLPAAEIENYSIPIGKKVKLNLTPMSFPVLTVEPPIQTGPKEPRYEIELNLIVAANGTYRVSLGEKVWVAVYKKDSFDEVQASRFEMQTKCGSIFKVVEFPLVAGEQYRLHINQSRNHTQSVLITKVD